MYPRNDCWISNYTNPSATAQEVLDYAEWRTLPGFNGVKIGDSVHKAKQKLGVTSDAGGSAPGGIGFYYYDFNGKPVFYFNATGDPGIVILLGARYSPPIYYSFDIEEDVDGGKTKKYPGGLLLVINDYYETTGVELFYTKGPLGPTSD